MVTLVPEAGALAPDVLVPGLSRPDLRPGRPARWGRGPAIRPARARRTRWLALMTLADLGSVVGVGLLVARSGVRVSLPVLAAVALLWVSLLMLSRCYDVVPHESLRGRGPAVLRAGAALGLVCWVLPTLVEVATPPHHLVLATLALVALALANRLIADNWAARAAATHGGTRTLLAGDPLAVARALTELRRVPAKRWNVVSACLTERLDDVDLGVPITLGVDDLAGVAATHDADAVLLLPCRELDPVRLRRLGWQLEETRTRLYVGTGLLDVAPARAAVVSVGDLGVVQLRPSPSRSPARAVKQVVERLGAALLLVLLLPALALVAVAIRCDSPGPVIFRQRRIGRDSTEFTMYKFRTMTSDAEARVADLAHHNESVGAVLFKIRQDPRITRVGAFLRRYSIDELPQPSSDDRRSPSTCVATTCPSSA